MKRRVLISGLLILALVAGIGLPSCGSPPVEIPDNDLNVMIRNAIGKQEGDIYPWELEELTEFRAGKKELIEAYHTVGMIYDLTGLEYCTNLEYLDLNHNPIRDITPLASLTKLNTLILNNAEITDVSPLASCIFLETLDLSNNQITDISPLASLTNLETLYLQDNMIRDISALVSMDSLKTLMLGPIWELGDSLLHPKSPGDSNQVSDLSPLSNLISLEYLNLNLNLVSDLEPIRSLVNLKKLFLYSNLITDISPLASLDNVVELNLSFNEEIKDISPLLGMTSLEKLTSLYGFSAEYSAEAQKVGETLSDRGVSFSLSEDSPP